MRTQNRGRESGKPGPGSPSAAVLKELSKSKLHRETRLETVKMIPAPMWALACLSQKPSFFVCQLEYSVLLNMHFRLCFCLK